MLLKPGNAVGDQQQVFNDLSVFKNPPAASLAQECWGLEGPFIALAYVSWLRVAVQNLKQQTSWLDSELQRRILGIALDLSAL